MEIGDTITCSDVELADVTHDLHKDGYQLKCEKIGPRKFKFTIVGKNERKKVEIEREDNENE